METEIIFSADESFFKGHFPGRPVTPGVMLIDKAVAAVERFSGKKIVLRELRKVKFSNPVLPGESVKLRIEQRSEGEAVYSFSKENVQCASGVMRFDIADKDMQTCRKRQTVK